MNIYRTLEVVEIMGIPLNTLRMVIGISLGFKREISKFIGFMVVALIAVGLVFHAGGAKNVLLKLFNKVIGTSDILLLRWYENAIIIK